MTYKYDQDAFFDGYEPWVAEDLADSVLFMLTRPERASIKVLDCVPTAQRSLGQIDQFLE